MIFRRIFAALAVLCAIAVPPAHAQKTKAQINTEITTNFPDNTVGQITPQGLRAVASDTVNSIMPTAPVVSGNFPCFDGTTGLLKDCGLSPTSIPFTQSGTGAVAVTIDALTRPIIKPEEFAPTPNTPICNVGTFDAGPSIQRAINYAGSQGASVEVDACVYYIVTPVVDTFGVQVNCRKPGGCWFKFAPTGDNQIAYRVRNAGTIINSGGIKGVRFYSDEATFTKTALEVEYASGYVVEDVIVGGSVAGSGGTLFWSGGTGSIGVRTRGFDGFKMNRVIIAADRPVVISTNPNSASPASNTIDADYYDLRGLSLAVNGTNKAIEIEDGTRKLTHLAFTNIACILGSFCFYNSDTTSTTSNNAIGWSFTNVGAEQGVAGGTPYNYYISRNTTLYNLSIGGFQAWDGVRGGMYMRNVQGVNLQNVLLNSNASFQCLDIDSTVHGLSWLDSNWHCNTGNFTGQNRVWAAADVGGFDLPRSAQWAATGDNLALVITSLQPTNSVALAYGGTGAALTADNGGVVYSNASGLAILAHNVTANFPLLSGASAAPTWAGITYPTSATSGGIPYFSTTSSMATSALLGANLLMQGGGAAAAPSTFTLGGDCTFTTPNIICSKVNGVTHPSSMTSGGILYASSTSAVASSALLAANQIVLGGGAGTAPATLGSLGTTTTVLHGNAGGAPSFAAVANADLATMVTNTVKGNATSGTATPTDLAVGTCSTSASALNWTTNTGFGCNTSINAATLGGATFAAPGAIGGGTPSTGAFTTVTAGTTITAGTSSVNGQTLANGPNSGTGAGSQFVAQLNSVSNIGMGNYSRIISGGAFDATPVIYLANPGMMYLGGDNALKFNNLNTAATSSTTGTLNVGGGLSVTGAIWAGTYINATPTVVNSLPSCVAGIDGARAFVTNNNTATAFAGAVTTGGANHHPVYCDGAGTAWKQGALEPANDNAPAYLIRKFA